MGLRALTCAALLVCSSLPLTSHAVTITLSPIENLVLYRHEGGDKDFFGHGPEMYVAVQLELDGPRMTIMARVNMVARETAPDWTQASGEWLVPVWKLCEGQYLHFRPDGSSLRIIGVAQDVEVSGTPIAGPVAGITVVGDTRGNDINDTGAVGDTRVVRIAFKPLDLPVADPACMASQIGVGIPARDPGPPPAALSGTGGTNRWRNFINIPGGWLRLPLANDRPLTVTSTDVKVKPVDEGSSKKAKVFDSHGAITVTPPDKSSSATSADGKGKPVDDRKAKVLDSHGAITVTPSKPQGDKDPKKPGK